MQTLPLHLIKVENRLREDLGDINELAQSILTMGLMHPVVIDQDNNLIAGGRRFAAYTLLASDKVNDVEEYNSNAFKEIPYTRLSDLNEAQRRMLEIEENVRRKDMTWQEHVLGLEEYHKIASRDAYRDGEKWSQEQTGALLNLSQAKVSIALLVAKQIRLGDEEIKKADNLTDAIKLVMQRKTDEASKELLRRTVAKREQTVTASPTILQNSNAVQAAQQLVEEFKQKEDTGISVNEISSFYHLGSCLDLLPKIAASTTINHIVCDPPYGIDMTNLVGDSIKRVSDEHVVDDNIHLLQKFLQVAFDCIAEDGFLCMWYDLDHHEKIRVWAEQIGWMVCRWPLVWCKTSPCQNSSAVYNITKSTEVCYIMRRSSKSMIKRVKNNNYVLAASASSPSHPFCKPEMVWNWLIDAVSVEGQTICDPFAGEGSSLAAIFNSGRIPVGIELVESHVANGLTYIKEKINANTLLKGLI